MKAKKETFRSSVLSGAFLFIAGGFAGLLLSGRAAAAQAVPTEIAPITAPFHMPQLKRPVFADRTFDIRDYGAVEYDGQDAERGDSTEAIGKAIEACSRAGGGTVLIPAGQWLTGAIHLKSNINLHAAEGAYVHFIEDLNAYLPVVLVRHEGVEAYNYSPLIYARDAENIAITGKGVFDGKWSFWRDWATEAQGGVGHGNREAEAPKPLRERDFGKGAGREGMRPNFVVPLNVKNVLVEGPTFKDGPMWNIHPVYCENVIIRDITVDSYVTHNGDGIVVDSSKNVLIEYVTLRTSDDAVVIKSGLNEDGLRIGIPSENIVVRNFVARDVRTGSGGVVFGSETSGGIRNVYVHDALFDGSDRGIRFKSTRGRGNVVENIFVENVRMRNITRQSINFNTAYTGGVEGGPAPRFRNVSINNIRVDGAARAIELIGLPEMWLEHITISNAVFENVREGAVIRRVKGLVLDDVTIRSDGRPITLDHVSGSLVRNVKLSGQQPPVRVSGSESGTIIIDGLAHGDVESADDVPEKAVGYVGVKLP